MKQLTLKRGSSFGATVAYTPAPNGPATLDGMTITSEVRTPAGKAVDTLAVALAPDGLSFNATAPAGTAAWPLGLLHWDIKFVHAGQVFYTETVGLELTAQVTQ